MALAPVPIHDGITALYLRISDDDGDALGVARQRKDMVSHAQRLGLPVEEFCDNSFSASRYARRKRPAFESMLRRIEAGEIRHVVVWDLSRLTRQIKELEHLIDLAEKGTVEVHTMTGKLDLRDPDGRAMATVVCAMNRKASDDTSKRIKRKQAEMREQGRYHGGGRPFGFEPSGAVVREAEAVLIREAATRVLAGEGLLTVAKDWNARGLAAPLAGGWRPKTIRDALLRPLTVTAGILRRETQEQLGAVLNDPTRRKQTTTARSHLLSGLLTCGKCGHKMRSKPRNDGKATYACDACHLSRLAEPVDVLISEAVLAALDTPSLTRPEPIEADEETGRLTDALIGYEARLSALEADFMDGGIDLATWKRMKAGLDARIDETRKVLARRAGKRVLASVPADVFGYWAKSSLDTRRAILGELIESITVLPADRGVRRFDPSKIVAVWRV